MRSCSGRHTSAEGLGVMMTRNIQFRAASSYGVREATERMSEARSFDCLFLNEVTCQNGIRQAVLSIFCANSDGDVGLEDSNSDGGACLEDSDSDGRVCLEDSDSDGGVCLEDSNSDGEIGLEDSACCLAQGCNAGWSK